MAGKRRRRSTSQQALPGWLWMLFGLAIGLAVALAVFLRDADAPRQPQASAQREAGSAATVSASMLDDNGENAAAAKPREQRFDFYDMLPNFEVIIPEQESDVVKDREPQAVVEPGVYILQAGSFTRYEDADRRRAELALQGIESSIQKVTIDDRTFHRVRIGPISDLNQLNLLRSRLRQASIDALRIRVAE